MMSRIEYTGSPATFKITSPTLPPAFATGLSDVTAAAAGSNAVYSKNRLERSFRDIHVAAQHVASAPAQLAAGGRVVLGVEHSMGGW